MKKMLHAMAIAMFFVVSCTATNTAPTLDPGIIQKAIEATAIAAFKQTLTANPSTPTSIPPSDTPQPIYTITPRPTVTPRVEPQLISESNAEKLQEVFAFNAPGKDSMSLYWSSDSFRLLVKECRFSNYLSAAAGVCYPGLTVFDPFSGKVIRHLSEEKNNNVSGLFSGNGQVISVVEDSELNDWKGYFIDIETGQHIGNFSPSIFGLNDSGEIAMENEGYGFFTANLSSNEIIMALDEVPDFYFTLGAGVFSRDGNLFAYDYYSNYITQIQVWDTTNGKAITQISISDLPPEELSFSVDGTRLIGHFFDQTKASVVVWDSITGKVIYNYQWDWPRELFFPLPAISPDGELLVIPNIEIMQNRPSSVIQIIKIESGELLSSISIPNNDVAMATFSGDGRYLAYASSSKDNADQWQIHILAVTP